MTNRAALAGLLVMMVESVIPSAWAQDRPPVTPLRDVDVTYLAGQGGKMVEQRSRFQASGQRLRVDTPTPGVYAIVDYRARTLAMVSDAERSVLDMPAPAGAAPGGLPATQRFARRGPDQVAGLACTEWETADTAGLPTLACFTDDGVLLRARRGTQVLVQAAHVAYGGLDPAAFTVPAGYAHTSTRGAR